MVRQSSGSHGQVLRPRVAQAPPMASRLYSTQKGQGAPKDGPEQLLLLLDHLQNVAGNSSSSAGGSAAGTPAAYFEAVKTTLLAGCKPQDKWRLVQCGEWEDYKDWSGPARTLMQFWATDAPRDEYARLTLAYNIWEIGPDGLPTGETFRSGTAYEKSTTRKRGKKYLNTCRLEPTPVNAETVILGDWLSGEFGVYKVSAKIVVATQRKRKDRKKPDA